MINAVSNTVVESHIQMVMFEQRCERDERVTEHWGKSFWSSVYGKNFPSRQLIERL